MPVYSPGRQANRNGRNWQLDMEDRFLRHGYQRWSQRPSLPLQTPYLIREYKSDFINIYGDKMTLDFLIYHPARHLEEMIIECKYQGQDGSIDEKLSFTAQSLHATGQSAILALMGGGFRDTAVRYCLGQQTEKFKVITTWDEFTHMLNTGQL